MNLTAKQASQKLKSFSSVKKAQVLSGFFKTGAGEYGEGDVFIGVTVPDTRKVVKEFCTLPSSEILKLLQSKIHEERLLALLILVTQFKKSNPREQKKIFQLYLKNKKWINNWDLVDTSAHDIVGGYLEKKNRKILYQLIKSKSIWDRRIAVLTTFHFIRQNDFDDILKLSKALLQDSEDLMHKACGWMLREMGKRNQKALIQFLNSNYQKMPRTMLRYSLERLPELYKKKFMKKS